MLWRNKIITKNKLKNPENILIKAMSGIFILRDDNIVLENEVV